MNEGFEPYVCICTVIILLYSHLIVKHISITCSNQEVQRDKSEGESLSQRCGDEVIDDGLLESKCWIKKSSDNLIQSRW